jgi:acyl carrier protein
MNCLAFVRHETGVDEISPDTNLSEIDLDSLEIVDLMLNVESYFSVRITPDDLSEMVTVGDLIRHVEA